VDEKKNRKTGLGIEAFFPPEEEEKKEPEVVVVEEQPALAEAPVKKQRRKRKPKPKPEPKSEEEIEQETGDEKEVAEAAKEDAGDEAQPLPRPKRRTAWLRSDHLDRLVLLKQKERARLTKEYNRASVAYLIDEAIGSYLDEKDKTEKEEEIIEEKKEE
jgi:hypothetical protein